MPKTDQGIDPQKYQITPRTLIFIFNTKGQVLLLRGAERKRLWAGLYNGIGGHVEAEEDIMESAQRELWEETGLREVALVYCGQVMIDIEPEMGVGVFIFRGMYTGEALKPSDEGDLAWVAFEEIDDLPLVEDLPMLIPRVAEYEPGAPLIIGKYAYDQKGNLQVSLRDDTLVED